MGATSKAREKGVSKKGSHGKVRLQSIETHLRCVDVNSFLGDIDVGDMFHNLMLHGDLQAYAGIDLTPYFQNETLGSQTPRTVWERWVRSAMGFKSSPYTQSKECCLVRK